jgi:hypothetical protein
VGGDRGGILKRFGEKVAAFARPGSFEGRTPVPKGHPVLLGFDLYHTFHDLSFFFPGKATEPSRTFENTLETGNPCRDNHEV